LLHLGFGYRYNDAKEGLRTSATPETNQAPSFLASGFIDNVDRSHTYNYELSWRKGQNWLHAEHINVDIDDSAFGELAFSGYHISFSHILTGEMRSYNRRSGIFNRIQIARPVNQNGWGAWEVGVRYSHTDLSDGPIKGGEMDIWTLGLNWWLRKDIMTSINWRHVELDKPPQQALAPVRGQSSGWTSRVVLILD
jgi:phosphate-selective porin OprO/OprP